METWKYAHFVHICYYFNATWENCQYYTRRNENTRTIKRNVQKLQSTFLLIFLALKLSSLNPYLPRQCISNNQFFSWPAMPKLTSDYADSVIIVLLLFFEIPVDIPSKAARNYFSNSFKWHTLFFLWQPFNRAQSIMDRCLYIIEETWYNVAFFILDSCHHIAMQTLFTILIEVPELACPLGF